MRNSHLETSTNVTDFATILPTDATITYSIAKVTIPILTAIHTAVNKIKMPKYIGQIGTTLLITLCLTTSTKHPAYACSCLASPSPTEAMETSTAVFSGQVISIEDAQWDYKVTFDVDTQWKGETRSTLVIHTAQSSSTCGYPFTEGETYLVYAHNQENTLEVSHCGRTTKITQAEDDINALSRPFDSPISPCPE